MTSDPGAHQSPQDPPHVVMLVANDVRADSRVQRIAHGLTLAGVRVTILGVNNSADREVSVLGNATVIRLPITPLLENERTSIVRPNPAWSSHRIHIEGQFLQNFQREVGAEIGWLRSDYFAGRRRRIDTANARESRRLEGLHRRAATLTSWMETTGTWKPTLIGTTAKTTLMFLRKLDRRLGISVKRSRNRRHERRERRLHRQMLRAEKRLRGRLSRAHQRRTHSMDRRRERLSRLAQKQGLLSRSPAQWRHDLGILHDYEAAFGPELDRMAADVIHVHDVHLLGVGARAAGRAGVAGRTTLLVYDAHEYVRGVARHSPRRVDAWASVEREYIHRADRVITVSEPLAEMLTRDHDLDAVPDVILNIPIREPTEMEDIRAKAQVPHHSPLIVYSGGMDEARGVHTLVEAVGMLDGAHLALVSRSETAYIQYLRGIAEEGGFASRVHVLPFVSPHHVVSYIRSATVGVHPLVAGPINHEVALPNKLFEYMQAGLPLVVSDCRAMSLLVSSLGIGEVFRSEDAKSLAESLSLVIDNVGRYREAYAANRDQLSRYSWEGQQDRLLEIYSDLLPWYRLTRDRPPSGFGRLRRAGAKTVGIGPMNMAGQAWQWAKSIERAYPALETEVFEIIRRKRLVFPADVRVEPRSWRSLNWQLEWARHVGTRYSHVLLESGAGVLGDLNGGTLAGDLAFLERHDIEVGVILHGSEARDPARHRLLVPHSPFLISTLAQTHQASTDSVRAMLDSFDGPVFVSTLDILDYVPRATWLPQVLDPTMWRPSPFEPSSPLRVLFAPTNPLLKGQRYVETVGARLESEGLISLHIPKKLRHEEMPELIADCDVLIDGLVLGLYGTTAVEGMATGRVVLANLSRVRDRQPSPPPIIDVDPDTLEATLRGIASDPGAFRDLAEAGPSYVSTYHDGRYAASQLSDFLGVESTSERMLTPG